MEKLSVFLTTYNNQRTLRACLESVKWADEIVLLDSYSADATLEIAEEYRCVISQHKFMGYGKQKQLALEQTTHDWVLLLDADEMLSDELQSEIIELMKKGPACDGYDLPRQEQLFWRMSSLSVRIDHHLRLFNKHKGGMSMQPVHAAPKVEGKICRLSAPFYHYGETDIHTKIEKLNAYSTGLVADKIAKKRNPSPWIMVFYPPLFFFKTYILKRNFVNGWAGFITSVSGAFYAFLKYAKLYEYRQFEKYGNSKMPKGAPPLPSDDRVDGVG